MLWYPFATLVTARDIRLDRMLELQRAQKIEIEREQTDHQRRMFHLLRHHDEQLHDFNEQWNFLDEEDNPHESIGVSGESGAGAQDRQQRD